MASLSDAISTGVLANLRECWQVRALEQARGKAGAVLLSVLAHSFDDVMLPMLHAAFPGFQSIAAPFLCSAGHVMPSGIVVADVVGEDGLVNRRLPLYASVTALRDDFRKLADALRLDDADRAELMAAVAAWLVADHRIDPTMDPQDPDARRLVH